MNMKETLEREMRRSNPDYVIYKPKSIVSEMGDEAEHSTFDNGNEHLLVFDGPDGSLMATWVQDSYEASGDDRIMFSRSDDEGLTWSNPRMLAGKEKPGTDQKEAHWGFPMVSRTGRIYVLYNQQGEFIEHQQLSGTMAGIYSDDAGKTWSIPQAIPMKRSPYDNPDENYPPKWIVWQKPERLSEGKYMVGFSRWLSDAVKRPQIEGDPWSAESVVEFMRFENIDDNPEPKDIVITNMAWGEKALRVGHYTDPLISVAQEPSIVKLPDDRLFCVMRTMTGYIWYSVSGDGGMNWCCPRPLLRQDYGRPILQPICCCPMYQLSDGRYILLHHGRLEGTLPGEHRVNRRPAFIALAEFRPDAEQPLWFSESKQLMDNDGKGIGPRNRVDIGVYSSFTTRNNNDVLWHPERKFFLLGKKITSEWLSDLKVPE